MRQRQLPEYDCWKHMIYRCYDTNGKDFKNYGGRGIAVSKRWRFGEDSKSGFVCFFEDMGPRPKGLTLERKNNDGNYCKRNCMWATRKQQRANQRPYTPERCAKMSTVVRAVWRKNPERRAQMMGNKRAAIFLKMGRKS
jgi:hypothetical protein